MKGVFLALLVSATAHAHTQPHVPKDVRVLEHMASAFAHHEVALLAIKPATLPPLPATCTLVPFVAPVKLVELVAKQKYSVPDSVQLVQAEVGPPATPPPTKR